MSRHSEEKHIARNNVGLYPHSHSGIIELTGEDRLQFLHNQTTNDIKNLKAGQGCEAVFVNSTGRTLDLATVYVTEEKIFLLVSAARTQFLMEWMDRYLFPMDRVSLKNVSEVYSVSSLMGEKSPALMEQLGATINLDQPFATHEMTTINEIPVRVAVGTELAIVGYTLIVASEQGSVLQETLTEAGAVMISEAVWDELSLEQGRPLPDYELTEDYNPLEAGLWKAISFDKGCYIGQETIARLHTYQGVKQRLWGLHLSQPVDPETPITLDGKKVGKLTRLLETEDGVKGLGYIRTKAGGEGLNVNIGDAEAKVIAVPFLTHPQ
ncbi:folate-binding protein YgfZ [Halothece sp. PCC 7418]|uniref:CAF17-like 4Fe-4S cluster assembly/insertion protein YgfZ n=1 Tax=Halothece sp. (strain PCC 7418) TaxID=65093 RepID=UPI0002A05D73|nr:folate-binding protein YgfZ [Halothece sp. PCC 7418]AFZ44829.1 folate-binding protein YgfZ [Halothece sp. PCC 7418]